MTKRVTVKPLMFIEECRNGIFEYNGERLFNDEIVNLINAQYEEIQRLLTIIADLETSFDISKHKNEELQTKLNTYKKTLNNKDEILSKTLQVNSNYEKHLKEIDDVLSKHNIHTLEKLDQVLTNERTW